MRTTYNLTPRPLQDCIPANSRKFSVNCDAILDAYARLPESVAVLTSIDEICAWIGIVGIHAQAIKLFGKATDANITLHRDTVSQCDIRTAEEFHGMKILGLFLIRYQAQQIGE